MKSRAIFGAGCFWSVEEFFRLMKGVCKTRAGYAGGDFPNPSYEDVCSGETGHIEVVEVTFDPAQISYVDLLDKFFAIHDAGGDHMSKRQYQSAIIFCDEEQRLAAAFRLAELSQKSRPAHTLLIPFIEFYPAEERHQQYSMKHKNLYHGTIHE